MYDLISRQAAIDTLERKKDKTAKGDIGNFYNTIIQNNIDEIKSLPPVQPNQRWIPCEERLPDEDNWLGDSGKQFSNRVFVSVVNSDNEDEWADVSRTIDGKWALELPGYCKVLAWMPMPEPYKGEQHG